MAHTQASFAHRDQRSGKPLPGSRNGRGGKRSGAARPIITVFGSAQARPGGRLYAAAYRMGDLLARAGFDLMTGGYCGVMEAASRGAHAAGALVWGITLDRFGEQVNPYVIKEIPTTSFYDRFGWLVDRADGYVAMHGGIGTLTEVTFTWQELLVGMVPARPLVLVGGRWRSSFKTLRANLIGPRKMYQPIALVATPEQALKRLLTHFPRLANNGQRA